MFRESFFRKAGRLSIILVFIVILLGSLVRVTGSGMGCPDWPTCFGMLIPPTDESQLEPDYKEKYKKPGHEVADFNVYHTYTEYINRLSGALLGLVLFITAISSFQFFKRQRWVTLTTVGALILTGYQGWLGAKVVDSYLAGWMVTIHMLVALVILAAIMIPVLYNDVKAERIIIKGNQKIMAVSILLLTVILFQIGLGTQVRETVDHITKTQPPVASWELALGGIFYFHRSFTILVLVLTLSIPWMIYRMEGKQHYLFKSGVLVLILILIQALTGILNIRADFPAVAQVIHIVGGTVAFGIEFYLIMVLWASRNSVK